MTYGGFVKIISYSFSIGSERVPKIELVLRVKLSLNNKPVEVAGKSGQVINVQLP